MNRVMNLKRKHRHIGALLPLLLSPDRLASPPSVGWIPYPPLVSMRCGPMMGEGDMECTAVCNGDNGLLVHLRGTRMLRSLLGSQVGRLYYLQFLHVFIHYT